MTQKFIHLTVRSDMTFPSPAPIGDYVGAARVSEYMESVAEMGHDAIAFTELGSMRGMFEVIQQSSKHGVRPIYGCEFYVTADMKKKGVPKDVETSIKSGLPTSKWREAIDAYAVEHGYMRKDKDLTTITLWAGDEIGLKNMFRLMYESWHPDHFYHKPRIDIDTLARYSDGVWAGTGGPNSYVNRPVIEGKRREAVGRLRRLHEIFEGRLRLEVRPQLILVQSKANKFAVKQSPKLGVPLLATGAVHYLNKGDLPAQKMLSAIGSRDSFDFAGLDFDGYWLRTGDEMIAGLEECGLSSEQAKAACDETVSLADQLRVDYKLDAFAMIIPPIETEGMSHNDYLRKLCDASPIWDQLRSEGADLDVYAGRMERELAALGRKVADSTDATFASYSLYVREVMEMGREIGIDFGPGRGSAAGSLVSWLIGITQIDPVKYGLSFERYLSPNRVGPPDIDVDCDPSKRAALFAKMRERWGDANVGQITAMGKLKGRAVVSDVCRELKIDHAMSKRATAGIELRSDYDHRPYSAAADAMIGFIDADDNTIPPVPAAAELHKAYPEVLTYAEMLEGKMRVLNTHAGGVVAAPRPLYEYVPMETRPDSENDGGRVYVTAFEKVGTEETGLLKIDMLGVSTINTIALAIEAVNERRSELGEDPITMDSIPYDDPATLAAFTDGDFAGVFQYDSASASRLCKGVTFDRFETVADMTALNRPGPLDNGTAVDYVERQGGRQEIVVKYSPEVSELLRDTYGIMVYQEQIMQIFGELAGHENPDKMRKIIGKKQISKMEAERPGFIAGMVANTSMDAETADMMFDDIAKFGRYSFNKSHSVAYARIGWITQWLKVHYPLEWSWAAISTADDHKRRHFAKDAAKRGVRLLPPDVSTSGYTLTMDRNRNAILGALTDVKGVGAKASSSIVSAQPFESFDDLMERVDRRAVHSGVMEKLARAGALDGLLPNPRWFVDSREDLFAASKRKAWTNWADALAPGEDAQQWSDSERMLEAATVNPMALENPYSKLLGELAVGAREDYADESFFIENDNRGMWVSGTIVEARVYQNTPFGDKQVTEAERGHRSYAAEFISAQLEDQQGNRVKIKVPWNVYEHCRDAAQDGSPVLAFVVPDQRYATLRAKLVVDLEGMRNGSIKNIWTELARGQHPADLVEWPNDKDGEYDAWIARRDYGDMLAKFHAGKWKTLPLVGMITDVSTKLAGKHKTEMAWLGVLTHSGEYTRVTVFSSDWLGGWDRRRRMEKPPMHNAIKPGMFVRLNVRSDEFQGRHSCILDGSWRVYGEGKNE